MSEYIYMQLRAVKKNFCLDDDLCMTVCMSIGIDGLLACSNANYRGDGAGVLGS